MGADDLGKVDPKAWDEALRESDREWKRNMSELPKAPSYSFPAGRDEPGDVYVDQVRYDGAAQWLRIELDVWDGKQWRRKVIPLPIERIGPELASPKVNWGHIGYEPPQPRRSSQSRPETGEREPWYKRLAKRIRT